MLSMTTDYANVSTGCPEPYLRRIAEAGFSHLHWCHHWNTDFLYCESEIGQIARWMADFGLAMTDVHGSMGVEKSWGSARDYERLAGVELVRNRVEMAARLGSDVVIMHIPAEPAEADARERFWACLRKSLDAVEPLARERGVRIALENLGNDNFDALERLYALYGPEVLGLCYDSGHGNLRPGGLDRLKRVKARLISLHLHDNDGSGDQHKLLFSGTVDWPRLAAIIAASPYRKPVSMEANMRAYPGMDEMDYLRQAFETGAAFAEMVEGNQEA